MDPAKVKHYLTTNGNVFTKDQISADISSGGFLVNGLEYWICNDIHLIMDAIEPIRDQPFGIRQHTNDYLGCIKGDSEIYLYVNPIKSSFVIPEGRKPDFPLVPNLVRISDGKLDFSKRIPPQWMNPATYAKTYPKNILIIENFNYLDLNTQRFIAELSLQVIVMVVAQVNYDSDEALDNLIPDYEQYETTSRGLVSDSEYDAIIFE